MHLFAFCVTIILTIIWRLGMARKRKKTNNSSKTTSSSKRNSIPVFEDISSGNISKNDDFFGEYKKNMDNDNTDNFPTSTPPPVERVRHLRQKRVFTFNNEEPVIFALKKMVFDLFAIFVFIASLLLVFAAIQLVFSKLGNDSIENLNVSSLYQGTVSVDDITVSSSFESDTADGVVNSIADFYGIDLDDDISLSPVPFILKTQFDDLISNNYISMNTNISNYSYITQIYTSLQQGNPVVVILSTEDVITYAIVTFLDSDNLLIGLTYTDGSSDTMTLDNFLLATRYNVESKLSFAQKFMKILGVYKVNTAFFISDMG